MDRLMERLKKEHCDVEDALARCMNMEELYLELLVIFAEDNQIEKLLEAYRRQDVENVFFYSHALKGVYTNLGMRLLFELDEPIVEGTREKGQEALEGLAGAVQNLYIEHNKLVSLIRDCI